MAAIFYQYPDQHEQELFKVDTKIWVRSNEFGSPENWLEARKPCSLIERVRVAESLVVSLDGLSDALESNLGDLSLPNNGVILLNEGDQTTQMDSTLKHFNEAMDCVADDQTISGSDEAKPFFEFSPNSDQLSWFNPDNWASFHDLPDSVDWIPESHRIPCTEDIVKFGHQPNQTSPAMNDSPSAKTFKVNFRPSQWLSGSLNTAKISGDIRIAQLQIGNISYNQQQFERLVNSDPYKNLLFSFNDKLSVLSFMGRSNVETPISIDESSIHTETLSCLDEAGCLCGNEAPSRMKVICSFHEPVKDDELACHDPISSSGYCNKVCASVILVTMDPDKFKESYIEQTLGYLFSNERYSSSLSAGFRRNLANSYEITVRLFPRDGNYESILGRDIELAWRLVSILDDYTTRTAHGIKTVNLRYSSKWRVQNKSRVFIVSSLAIMLVSITVLIVKSQKLDDANWRQTTWSDKLMALSSCLGSCLSLNQSQLASETDSFIRFDERTNINSFGTSSNTDSHIPLLDLDDAFVRKIDAQSESR